MLLLDAFQPSQARRRDGPRGRYDPVLLLAIIALVSIGIVMVASASIAVADGRHIGAFYYLKRHLLFLGLGSVLAVIAMRVELKVVEKFSMPLMVLGMAAMLAVFVPGLGMRINGARRWLNLGASFQPVEAVKLILIVYLASYLVRHKQAVEHKLFGTVNPLVVAGLLVISLLLQPDFGSSTLIIAVTVGMIWLGGGRMRYLFGMAGMASLLMAAAAFSERYRVRRLMTFLDPWKDPFKDGFQLTQALIAIGRGEWTGVGLGESVQKLFYLPEAHTDFILAVIGEELGLTDKNRFAFAWIVDFPIYEKDAETGEIDFEHNPFSMPQGGMEALNGDPLDVLGFQYDLACNGYELVSGAIRNHRPEIMFKAFEIAGYGEDEVKKRFGGMVNAFRFGAPPHGGCAAGIDRIVMLLADEANIREVMLFPMNQRAEDLMMDAPSEPTNEQLRELRLRVLPPED